MLRAEAWRWQGRGKWVGREVKGGERAHGLRENFGAQKLSRVLAQGVGGQPEPRQSLVALAAALRGARGVGEEGDETGEGVNLHAQGLEGVRGGSATHLL